MLCIIRVVAIRFEVVKFLVCAYACYSWGDLRACSSEAFWNLEATRLLLRPFWANVMLLGGQTTEFDMYGYLPYLPIASYPALLAAFLAFHILCSIESTHTCTVKCEISVCKVCSFQD